MCVYVFVPAFVRVIASVFSANILQDLFDQGLDSNPESMSRRTPKFSTRTAEEDVSRLDPSESTNASPEETGKFLGWRHGFGSKLNPSGAAEQQRHSLPSNFFSSISRFWDGGHSHEAQQETQEGARAHTTMEPGPLRESSVKDKGGHKHHSTDHHHAKLGTYSGVFVPTTLNVLSILMFLRFSFILGQTGVLGMLGTSFSSEC